MASASTNLARAALVSLLNGAADDLGDLKTDLKLTILMSRLRIEVLGLLPPPKIAVDIIIVVGVGVHRGGKPVGGVKEGNVCDIEGCVIPCRKRAQAVIQDKSIESNIKPEQYKQWCSILSPAAETLAHRLLLL